MFVHSFPATAASASRTSLPHQWWNVKSPITSKPLSPNNLPLTVWITVPVSFSLRDSSSLPPGSERLYSCSYDFIARNSTELSVQQGETLEVLKSSRSCKITQLSWCLQGPMVKRVWKCASCVIRILMSPLSDRWLNHPSAGGRSVIASTRSGLYPSTSWNLWLTLTAPSPTAPPV